MSNVVNQVSYLRVSRDFPDDLDQLVIEINKAYLDIAQTVNARTIGIFSANQPAITGNQVFTTSQRRQTLRQVYTFTGTGNIPHGIRNYQAGMIFTGYGSYNNGTNDYGLIYGSSTAIAGQVSFYVTPANIVIQAGAGAPSITSGYVVIEWLSAP